MPGGEAPVTMLERGKKLVVQMVETFRKAANHLRRAARRGGVAKKRHAAGADHDLGDDVTHLLTEEGIAYQRPARWRNARR